MLSGITATGVVSPHCSPSPVFSPHCHQNGVLETHIWPCLSPCLYHINGLPLFLGKGLKICNMPSERWQDRVFQPDLMPQPLYPHSSVSHASVTSMCPPTSPTPDLPSPHLLVVSRFQLISHFLREASLSSPTPSPFQTVPLLHGTAFFSGPIPDKN